MQANKIQAKNLQMSRKPIFELQNVCWQPGMTMVVDRVNWRLMPGQHTAVLGMNGSGKTSIVRMATGYVRPNRGGTVLWQGADNVDLRVLRRRIGWVASTINAEIPWREQVLPLVASGRHAELGLRPPIRTPATEDELDESRALLEELDCGSLSDRRFVNLSQGEQQKILLARALMALPLLIVLDEPCIGLDPGAREQFLATLEKVLAKPDGPTLVMVTHHIEEILPAIERVLVVADGRIATEGTPQEVLTAPVLEGVYGKSPERIEVVNGRRWPIW